MRHALTATLAVGTLALASVAMPLAGGTAHAQTLNIAVGGAFTSMDPHFFNLGPNNAMTRYVFSRLAEFDAKLQPLPDAAESWTAISPTVWEFKLRPGITFHDGTPMTADDVVFSFERIPTVPNSPGTFNVMIKPVTKLEVIDARTIRMHTATPMPLLPAMMIGPAILSRKIHTGMTTADFNSGKAAIGSGPYRLTSFTLGDRAVFARNETWFRPKPHWQTVNYRMIPNDAARTAALQSGDVDVIDQVAPRDVASLRQNPKLVVNVVPGMRLIYLYTDDGRETTPFVTGADGKPLASNPLRDPRVRKALSLAINRDGIRERIMDNAAVPTGQLMPDGTMGYDPKIKPDPYNPDAAKKLLADAGYPNGFAITLHGPNDRYVNDGPIVEAIAQMWTRIGVKTQVQTMPSALFFGKQNNDEFSANLLGWGSDTGEADSNLAWLIASPNPALGRQSKLKPTHYANPAVDALIDRSMEAIDKAARQALYEQATELAMADTPIIPIHHQVNIWAYRKGLKQMNRMNEETKATDFLPE